MVSIFHDPIFGFYELFNHDNGNLIRFDTLENGRLVEPSRRSFPELIDVGIMGHCSKENYRLCKSVGVKCYQQGAFINTPHMRFEDYCLLLSQIENKTFQVSLGGAGDPNKHPDFERILRSTREKRIVPNLTTSGYNLQQFEVEAIKEYCGGVAVSWYSQLDQYGKETDGTTIDSVKILVDAGCTVNVHYVISKNSFNDICRRLEYNLFPEGIHAVIFLLHKSVGLGRVDEPLILEREKAEQFFHCLQYFDHPFKIGFDTCFSPLLLKFMPNLLPESIDYCEAARFSMYIDSQMNAYPCSFAIDEEKYRVSLLDHTIEEVWNSTAFEMVRDSVSRIECSGCKDYLLCHGSCPINITNICPQNIC